MGVIGGVLFENGTIMTVWKALFTPANWRLLRKQADVWRKYEQLCASEETVP